MKLCNFEPFHKWNYTVPHTSIYGTLWFRTNIIWVHPIPCMELHESLKTRWNLSNHGSFVFFESLKIRLLFWKNSVVIKNSTFGNKKKQFNFTKSRFMNKPENLKSYCEFFFFVNEVDKSVEQNSLDIWSEFGFYLKFSIYSSAFVSCPILKSLFRNNPRFLHTFVSECITMCYAESSKTTS